MIASYSTKKERERYKSLHIEKNTYRGQKKLVVEIASGSSRVIGDNARRFNNDYGLILRSIVLIPIHPWKKVAAQYGERMWKQVLILHTGIVVPRMPNTYGPCCDKFAFVDLEV